MREILLLLISCTRTKVRSVLLFLYIVMVLVFVKRKNLMQNFRIKGVNASLQRLQRIETRVIIYAKYRTGSTFASEFFVKHDKSFFVFEPLLSVYRSVGDARLRDVSVDILKDLLQCKIYNSIYHELINNTMPTFETFCHPDAAQPACSQSIDIDMILSKAELVCRESKFKIIKTTRVNHLHDLAKFMAEGVKVVHLIRDPRGIFTSRGRLPRGLKKSNSKNFQDEVNAFCQVGLSDLYFIEKFVHKENYYFVRFEDLAFFPMQEGHLLYDYIDIQPTHNLSNWMKNVDIGNKTPWKSQPISRKDAFTTNRTNSAYSSQSWREIITKGKLYVIQKVCQEFMDKTGYIPIEFEKVMKYSVPALRSVRLDRLRNYTPYT